MFAVAKNTPRGELRKFGATILIGLGAIGLLIWWLKRPADPTTGLTGWQVTALVFWCAGVAIAGCSYLAPLGVARRVYAGWMTAAMLLGAVMTRVLFTVLFVVLLPIFALIRLRDPLRKRLDAESYWEPHERDEPTLERVSRLF